MWGWRSDANVIGLSQGFELRSAERLGRLGPAHRPGQHVDILFLEQRLEPGEFGLVPVGVMRVEVAADEVIGLARAAVPSAKARTG